MMPFIGEEDSLEEVIVTTPLEYHYDHVHLYCSDHEATERWFVEKIGAQLVKRGQALGAPMSELRLGGGTVLIRGARPGEQFAPPGARRFGTDHFGLRVADVDATIAELRRRGVTIDMEPKDFNPSMRIAFVKGPDDVRIELVQLR